MSAPQWFTCGFCQTQGFGHDPVHGDGPCPYKMAESDAFKAKLDAERAYFERQAFAVLDAGKGMGEMIEALKKSMGMFGEED